MELLSLFAPRFGAAKRKLCRCEVENSQSKSGRENPVRFCLNQMTCNFLLEILARGFKTGRTENALQGLGWQIANSDESASVIFA